MKRQQGKVEERGGLWGLVKGGAVGLVVTVLGALLSVSVAQSHEEEEKPVATVPVKIRTATTDAAAMQSLSSRLTAHGFHLRRSLPPLGLMTGDVEPAQIPILQQLEGVEAVEPEEGVQLPTFDKDTPQ
ncbi:MAG: hypothetical protein KTR21_04070 [Rhodobacteraceae bacterium]|nr:hypothetical protein [Paracoccaceae bacterium]